MELVLFTLALGAFTIWWLLSPKQRLRQMGDRIPGPKPYPIVGNVFNFSILGTRALEDWKNSVEKFGGTFRFWLGPQLHIFITEPDDMQAILSSQTLITKSESYNTLHSWLGSGLLVSTGELWQRRRKAITPTFHFKILEEFVPTFDKCANILVKLCKEKIGKGFFPLTEYMSNCALDVVSETAMGTELKAQSDPLAEYPNALLKMTNSLMEKVANPLLGFEPIYTLSGRRSYESNLLKILFSVPQEVIRRKENEKTIATDSSTESEVFGIKKKIAFLELLLKMKNNKAPAFQTEKDVRDEVVTFMFEGHDTTTMSLTFTTWLLGKHLHIQEELYNEVSSILVGQEPTIENYQKMSYLDRVLKESLRLYPSVPIIARMATEDIVLPSCGYVIPTGAQLDIAIYQLHRNPNLFPDPEKFDPDRFLEPLKHPYGYIPFSAGPRNCIGQKFVILLMKAIISNLVLNFKIESDDDMVLNPELLLRTLKGPNVRLTSRN